MKEILFTLHHKKWITYDGRFTETIKRSRKQRKFLAIPTSVPVMTGMVMRESKGQAEVPGLRIWATFLAHLGICLKDLDSIQAAAGRGLGNPARLVVMPCRQRSGLT